MSLDDDGIRRAGLAYEYRTIPTLVASILYGFYIIILIQATRTLYSRSLRNRNNLLFLFILYALFILTTALWVLQVNQLIGIRSYILLPASGGKAAQNTAYIPPSNAASSAFQATASTDQIFGAYYDFISRETRTTHLLFQCQMIVSDILVIWRIFAIWYNKRILGFIPLSLWILLVINLCVRAGACHVGVATSKNYTPLCKAVDLAAPILSIAINVSVMGLTIWKMYIMWDLLKGLHLKPLPCGRNTHQVEVTGGADSVGRTPSEKIKMRRRAAGTNRLLALFVLLIESGTVYVIVLTIDLILTSLFIGKAESTERMIAWMSSYITVQLVGIYPTLMIVILRKSVWNSQSRTSSTTADSTKPPSTCKFRVTAASDPECDDENDDYGRNRDALSISLVDEPISRSGSLPRSPWTPRSLSIVTGAGGSASSPPSPRSPYPGRASTSGSLRIATLSPRPPSIVIRPPLDNASTGIPSPSTDAPRK